MKDLNDSPYDVQRRFAYEVEADSFCSQALAYDVEARAWMERGREDKAAEAGAKAIEARSRYLEKKEEIRARFPDAPETAAAEGESEGPGDAAEPAPNAGRFVLSASGVYHRGECASAPANGEVLTPAEIAAKNPDARPCAKCRPSAIE